MRAKTALTAVGLTWLGLRLVACGYDYDALKGTAGGQGGRGPALGAGGSIAIQVSGAAGADVGAAGGAGGQPSPAGAGGQAGATPIQPGTGGTVTGTGAQPSTGGVSGAAGAQATGGTSGAAGASNGVGGSGGSLPPVYVSYPFDQTVGPALTDESGNGRGGALEGTATFGAGIVRNALELDGTAGSYVRLPAGLVATLRDATIAFWVRPRANASSSTAWQRVFDFGVNTTKYMFFTSYSTNYSGAKVARFGITVSGNYNEQRLDASAPLPGATWTHVAIVLGASGAVLYLNGVANATNTAVKLRPIDLGVTVNDWLGRSQFASDPYFNGDIDELRIYAAALTPAQVAAVYQQR